jgi:hypothetical protein
VTKPPTVDITTPITDPVIDEPATPKPPFSLPTALDGLDLPEEEPEVVTPPVINTKPSNIDTTVPVAPPVVEPETPKPSFKPTLPPVLDEVDLPEPEEEVPIIVVPNIPPTVNITIPATDPVIEEPVTPRPPFTLPPVLEEIDLPEEEEVVPPTIIPAIPKIPENVTLPEVVIPELEPE